MGSSKASDNALMRIFWPLDFRRSEQAPGVLVGWRNSDMDIFVVAVIRGINVCASSFQQRNISRVVVVA